MREAFRSQSTRRPRPPAPGADWRPQCAGTEAGPPFPHPLPVAAQFSRLRLRRCSWSSRHGSVAGSSPGAGRGRGRGPGAGGGRGRHRLRAPQEPRAHRLLSHRPGKSQPCARAEWRAVVPGPGGRDPSWGAVAGQETPGSWPKTGSSSAGMERVSPHAGPAEDAEEAARARVLPGVPRRGGPRLPGSANLWRLQGVEAASLVFSL